MLHTPICDLLGIDTPLFGFTPSPQVAAAISRAGGFGVLGAIRYTDNEELDAALTWMDEHVAGKPYGLDFVMPQGFVEGSELEKLEGMIPEKHRKWVESVLERYGVPPLEEGDEVSPIRAWIHSFAREQVDIALRHPKIKLFVNALGSPPKNIIDEAHEKDILVAALAGKPKHALGHKKAGVDIIVAQGYEAGGHTGEIASMVLVPEIVDAVGDMPVLAAGGIGSGRQMAAAFALGAMGAWTGSIWLAADEFQEEPAGPDGLSIVKKKLLEATSSDTVRSRVISGKPARMLRTPWTEAWEAEDSPGTLPMPLQGILVAEAERRIRKYQSPELTGIPVGQIVGRMNEVRPVQAIFDGLVGECRATLDQLAKLR